MIELHQDENILVMRRKHWFVLMTHLAPFFLLYILPFVLITTILHVIDTSMFHISIPSEPRLEMFLTLYWTLIIWILCFIVWTDYHLDVWILTDKRIIDIEQCGFFRREVSSFRYEQIQDMTVKIGGMIPTFLNFGTLEVQTAGTAAKFHMHGVSDPNGLRDIISDHIDEQERSPTASNPDY